MPKMTNAEAAKKWKDRLSGAQADIVAGVARVTESPMVKSAAAEDKWFQKIQAAHNSGKRKRALLAVSLETWKKQTAEVGAPRVSSGAAAAEGKVADFYAKLFPFEEALQNKVKAMPDVSLSDSVARSSFWITQMATFDKTK